MRIEKSRTDDARVRLTQCPICGAGAWEDFLSSATGRITVSFPEGHLPLRLEKGCRLPEHLTVENSPVLFGCRTGICGTCLVRVEAPGGRMPDPPGPEERETLDLVCPGESSARLACQLHPSVDVRLETWQDRG